MPFRQRKKALLALARKLDVTRPRSLEKRGHAGALVRAHLAPWIVALAKAADAESPNALEPVSFARGRAVRLRRRRARA